MKKLVRKQFVVLDPDCSFIAYCDSKQEAQGIIKKDIDDLLKRKNIQGYFEDYEVMTTKEYENTILKEMEEDYLRREIY